VSEQPSLDALNQQRDREDLAYMRRLLEQRTAALNRVITERDDARAQLTRVEALCEAKEDAQRRFNKRWAERNIIEAKTGRVFQGVPILTCREVRAALKPEETN